MMNFVHGTEENFDQEVLRSEEKVLVDFYADWCGPCKMVAPIVEEIASEGTVKVVKINVDESPNLARKYRIMTIPTLAVFKGGDVTSSLRGAAGKQEILDLVEQG